MTIRRPSEKNAKAFRGKRPGAQFARYALNHKEIQACYSVVIEHIDSGDFPAFQRVMKRFEELENYVLNG